jgi:hypothetical protein
MEAGQRLPDKTGFNVFTCLSLWGEQTGENIIYCSGKAKRKKLSGFPIPVACCRHNFSPVRAAFLSLWPAAEPIFYPVRAEDTSAIRTFFKVQAVQL